MTQKRIEKNAADLTGFIKHLNRRADDFAARQDDGGRRRRRGRR